MQNSMQNKIKKIVFIVLTVACFFFAAMILLIGFGGTALHLAAYSEKYTNKYEATFVRQETQGSTRLIYVQEFDEYAFVFNSGAVADEQSLNALTEGDHIIFRTLNKIGYVDDEDYSDRISIVFLSSNGNEIVTFESSKSVVRKSSKSVKIQCSAFAAVFFVCGVVLALYCSGVIPFKRKISN